MCVFWMIFHMCQFRSVHFITTEIAGITPGNEKRKFGIADFWLPFCFHQEKRKEKRWGRAGKEIIICVLTALTEFLA